MITMVMNAKKIIDAAVFFMAILLKGNMNINLFNTGKHFTQNPKGCVNETQQTY
jgi:hypothetical protein